MDLQIGVVVGHTLSEPQALRVYLVFVVERPKLNGPQTFHVPGVKVLVAGQAEPLEVGTPGRSRFARDVQRHGILVLQAVPRSADDVEEIKAVIWSDAPQFAR